MGFSEGVVVAESLPQFFGYAGRRVSLDGVFDVISSRQTVASKPVALDGSRLKIKIVPGINGETTGVLRRWIMHPLCIGSWAW